MRQKIDFLHSSAPQPLVQKLIAERLSRGYLLSKTEFSPTAMLFVWVIYEKPECENAGNGVCKK